MTKHYFSYKELFTFGWAKTKQHAWFIVLTGIILGIVCSAVEHTHTLKAVVSLLVTLSIASISLTIARDHGFSFADLTHPLLSYKKVLKFFVLSVLLGLPVFISLFPILVATRMGSIGGIVFGFVVLACAVYYIVRFKFYPYVVLEHENASIRDLVKTSLRLTKGKALPVFVFILLAGLLNALGALLLLVGLFVTIPVTLFASARLYDTLKEHVN